MRSRWLPAALHLKWQDAQVESSATSIGANLAARRPGPRLPGPDRLGVCSRGPAPATVRWRPMAAECKYTVTAGHSADRHGDRAAGGPGHRDSNVTSTNRGLPGSARAARAPSPTGSDSEEAEETRRRLGFPPARRLTT